MSLLVVTLCGALGVLAGVLLPGVVRRVPAAEPVLVRGAAVRRERPARQPGEPPLVAVAAVSAAVLGLLGWRPGWGPDLPAFLYLGVVGVALGFIDVRHHRLPDALTLPSYAIGLALLLPAALVAREPGQLLRAAAGAMVLGAFYLLLALLRPADLGLGDVKLAGLLGLYLGWLGWGVLLAGAFFGFLLGGLAGLLLLAAGRATRRSAIPLGPYMLLGALVAVLAGPDLVGRWLGA